jgi:hypothetical protein
VHVRNAKPSLFTKLNDSFCRAQFKTVALPYL